MKSAYLLSYIDHDDVSSSIYLERTLAESYIAASHPEYKKVAEDVKDDVQYWRKPTGEGILLERLKVETEHERSKY